MESVQKLRILIIEVISKIKSLRRKSFPELETTLMEAVSQLQSLYIQCKGNRCTRGRKKSEKEVNQICDAVRLVMKRLVESIK